MSSQPSRSFNISIKGKLVLAFLCGCVVVLVSWATSRLLFRETFATLELVARPNLKLELASRLQKEIYVMDQAQKLGILRDPEKAYSVFRNEARTTDALLDTLASLCKNDTLQLGRITRMRDLLHERDELVESYILFRKKIKGKTYLPSNYFETIKDPDTLVVRTTLEKTITSTTVTPDTTREVVTDNKESFIKRLFGKKRSKPEAEPPPREIVTENINITVDSITHRQTDVLRNDLKRVIEGLETDRQWRRSELINHELRLAAANSSFIEQLQQLLRLIQSEEIAQMQENTANLESLFTASFTRSGLLIGFLVIVVFVLGMLILFDVSQANRNRMLLLEAKERAERLEQSKHRFLANMSHEIRTPLQSIIGYSELLLSGQQNPAALDIIKRSGDHLLQIVNEVLDYSRITAEKFKLDKLDFNMHELLAEVADIMEASAEQKGLEFRFQSELTGGEFCHGDPFRLKQILYNLLGNAIKFTNKGMITFRVKSRRISENCCRFEFYIRDTGIGIDRQHHNDLFKPFERGGAGAQHAGSGLGLSITKSLVELQHGSISFSSEKGKGSEFRVSLDYLETEKPAQQSSETEIRYDGLVMVVDDDEFILQLFSSYLQGCGIRHISCSSGNEALEKCNDEIKVYFIDMRMPGMDGPELFNRLKIKSPEAKFFAVTAQVLPEERSSVLAAGFDGILLKPFRKTDLARIFSMCEGNIQQADFSAINAMSLDDEALLAANMKALSVQTEKDRAELQNGILQNSNFLIAGACHRLAAKAAQLKLNSYQRSFCEAELRARKGMLNAEEKNRLLMLSSQLHKLVSEKLTATSQYHTS